MARLEYFIVCRSVSVDIDTDELTLSQVVEDVFLEETPFVLQKIVGVSSWEIAPEELETDFQAVLRVMIPGNEHGVDFPMNLARGRRRHRAMLGVVEIPLDRPGSLKFEVLLNGQHSATHNVTVHPPGVRQASETDARLLRV